MLSPIVLTFHFIVPQRQPTSLFQYSLSRIGNYNRNNEGKKQKRILIIVREKIYQTVKEMIEMQMLENNISLKYVHSLVHRFSNRSSGAIPESLRRGR